MASYHDTYYFEAPPEEIDRLIAKMGLQKDMSYGKEGDVMSHTLVSPLPGCPDFATWEDAQQFRGSEDGVFTYLITDPSRTQVYVSINCI